MLPRRQHAEWLPSSGDGASVSPHPAISRRCHRHIRVARHLLVLLCVYVALTHAVQAESDTSAAQTSHFNGLRVISGSSFRAFTNRFRRNLRGKADNCLSFHEADNWWRYEWCVGRHVRQFHVYPPAPAAPEDAPAPSQEWSIVLGRFASDTSKSMRILPRTDDLDTLRNPDVLGYYASQQYPRGDTCASLAGKPQRSVQIQYKCCVFRANETYIESVDESSVCKYTMAVCTPVACGLMQKDQYVFGASTFVSEEERLVLVDTVKEMFYHAYHGYMEYAFPLDALLPLSCKGERFELGKIPMLTLIDTLDTLAIFEDGHEFQRAVKLIVRHSTFDLDTEVSVFETTIRVLGGLLSAHLLAIDPKLGLFPQSKTGSSSYNNELLALAIDLGDRLMPAFNTTTGIPYGTVNLRHGVPKGETPIASTAGAGSLSMEFTMLSALTGNASYATASRNAVRALYERRSQVGLLGKHIDTHTGEWTETVSGPGSNSDSFYEYLWKMYATFGDNEMLAMFDGVYAAVMQCNLHGDWFADVSMWSGCAHGQSVVFENLVAFWPGMQASLGHMQPAARSMNAFYRVWREYGFVPEQFNVLKWKPVRSGSGARYPLRPELIESTFYMHEATNDSTWLRAGAHFVHSLQKHTKTKCGYATVKDIERKELEDNMPSFFLSETCKYLYLLFNTTHFLRNGDYVFTTEAHPFPVLKATQVEPILFPTTTTRTTTTATTTTTTKTKERRQRGVASWRQCAKPVFWHALGYQLDYEGVVVDRTERCARPMSAKTATGAVAAGTAAAAAAQPGKAVADEWLSLLEKQLRPHLAQLKQQQHQPQDGETQEGGLRFTSENTDVLMARLSGGVVPLVDVEDLDDDHHHHHHHGDAMADDPRASTRQYLQGGARLGLFHLDRIDGVMRFTRQDTGEWLEIAGVDDARFTVLSWLPERRGFSAHDEKGDEDDELPLLLPRHRVYDFIHGHTTSQPALRRRCSLQVDVGPVPQNPYASSSSSPGPKSFAFDCVSSSFGVLPSDPGTQRVPTAPTPMVLAEPLDGCVPFADASRVRHKIVIVKRGTCFFETKARNVAAAGALGIVVVNNDEEDRVMVMSGSHEPVEEDENEAEEEENRQGSKETEDVGQSVALPAVMVPRRVGEWLHRQLVKTGDRGVRATIVLSVQTRDSDVAMIHDYLQATSETEIQASVVVVDPSETETEISGHAATAETLRRQVYPRLERRDTTTTAGAGAGVEDAPHLRVFAPEWGVDLQPVWDARRPESISWLLQIVATEQTIEDASRASP